MKFFIYVFRLLKWTFGSLGGTLLMCSFAADLRYSEIRDVLMGIFYSVVLILVGLIFRHVEYTIGSHYCKKLKRLKQQTKTSPTLSSTVNTSCAEKAHEDKLLSDWFRS